MQHLRTRFTYRDPRMGSDNIELTVGTTAGAVTAIVCGPYSVRWGGPPYMETGMQENGVVMVQGPYSDSPRSPIGKMPPGTCPTYSGNAMEQQEAIEAFIGVIFDWRRGRP